MKAPDYRAFNIAIVILAGILLAAALILEYGQGLAPCSLCLIQRFWVVAVGALACCALLLRPVRYQRKGWALATALAALAGAGFSIRQLYLQSLPPEMTPACSLGVDYILKVMPLGDALLTMMQGSGQCAEVVWRFLGLSIPGWTLLGFLSLASLASLHFVVSDYEQGRA